MAVMTRESPFLTSKVGPGNCPFTVIELWTLHSLFTGVSWIFFRHETSAASASPEISVTLSASKTLLKVIKIL
jgi:hypothetical protein